MTPARAALPRLERLRGAAWALQATLSARRQLRLGPAEAVRLRTSARLPAAAGRGVHAVLRRLEPSCLERALVLQSWLHAHGESRQLVIGVTAPTRDFRAHAWLDGEPAPGFTEIARLVR